MEMRFHLVITIDSLCCFRVACENIQINDSTKIILIMKECDEVQSIVNVILKCTV